MANRKALNEEAGEVGLLEQPTSLVETTNLPKINLAISAVRFETALLELWGQPDTPLVIHRFSAKTKQEMKIKMEAGKPASNKKDRSAKSTDKAYEDARYRLSDGSDGFVAYALRNACISACRLTSMKMTLARLSIFIVADGKDIHEPQIPLVRILGEPHKQEDMARVEGGKPYVTVRAAYFDWKARVRIRWDADQFSLTDVVNLMNRAGQQVGIGEGRPDSKKSCGLGWGLFSIERAENAEPVDTAPGWLKPAAPKMLIQQNVEGK